MIGHDVASGETGRPQGHSIWLNYQGKQVLVGPEQLRWATPEDIMAWNLPGDVHLEDLGFDSGRRVTYTDKRWTPPPAERRRDRRQTEVDRQEAARSRGSRRAPLSKTRRSRTQSWAIDLGHW